MDGYVTDTTPSPADGDTTNTPQDNQWESRYAGLQKVVAKRDEALNTATAELDRLRAEHEAAQNELATFRQATVDASEEETARQQYEALKERFAEPNPKPIGNNPARPARGWEEGSEKRYADRERTGTSQGFPI
jgi:hypothetical protein